MVLKDSMNLLQKEPEPLLKSISGKRKPDWIRCPAVQEFCKNTFVVRNPFYYEIHIDYRNKIKNVKLKPGIHEELVQQINHNLVEVKESQGDVNHVTLHTIPRINYIAKYSDSVELEVMPPFFHKEFFEKNISLIPGKFNISKWVRPVEFAFEVDVLKTPQFSVTFEEDEPLYYLRFKTKGDDDIEFEYLESNAELWDFVKTFTGVKNIRPKLSLESCYNYAKKHLLSRAFRKYVDKNK